MITGRWHNEGPPPDACARLWQSVFNYDGDALASFASRDNIARAASLYDEQGRLAAAGRMYYHDGAFWIEALAVREDLRGHGYGDLLIRMMLDLALKHAARQVKLFASPDSAAFFTRYGFTADQSPDQTEPYLMTAPAGAINLSGCAIRRPSRTSN